MNKLNLLNKIDLKLKQKSIFCMTSWINNKLIDLGARDGNNLNESVATESILREIRQTNISTFIDRDLISQQIKGFSNKEIKYFFKGYLFLQINSILNIAEPINNKSTTVEKEPGKIESKFLEDDEEKDEPKLNEKSLLMFSLSNGSNEFFGCEYEKIDLLKDLVVPKYQKIIIGPEIEIRRGYIYLRNSTFSLL